MLFLLGLTARPAEADDATRTRVSALKFWTPSNGYISVYPSSTMGHPIVDMTVNWQDANGMIDLYGSSKRAFQMKFSTSNQWTEGYSSSGYAAHNFPSASTPFRDVLEPGDATPGWGVADANYLQVGVNYYAKFAVHRVAPATETFPSSVRMVASTNQDDNMVGCSFDISFCVFDDYSHTALRTREFAVTGDSGSSGGRYWWANILANPSFESGTTGTLANWSFSDGARDAWCSGYARRSYCFADFMSSNPYGVYMWHDTAVATKASDHYTMEASLRCPYGDPTCTIAIYVQGIGVGPTETRTLTVTLPGNGYWYDCRLDSEHGFLDNDPFIYDHNSLRVTIGNFNPNRWVDVDRVFLGNHVARVTSTVSDPTGRPAKGPTCTLGDVW
jgi:hypothetical protein